MNMEWPFNQCRRYAADISLLAADALADEESSGVQAHLAECPVCRTRFAELKRLAGSCEQLANALPQVEPSVAFRRRWMTAVHASASPHETAPATIVAWISGSRLAWGSLAALWALVLFFRFAAPDAPRPASVALAPPSLREALLVLKIEQRESPFRAEAGHPVLNKPRPSETLPPRSQRPGSDTTKETEAA